MAIESAWHEDPLSRDLMRLLSYAIDAILS
jgi:hypothetical protein